MKRILKKVMKRSEGLENEKNVQFWEIFKERIFWREIELRGKGERDWGVILLVISSSFFLVTGWYGGRSLIS